MSIRIGVISRTAYGSSVGCDEPSRDQRLEQFRERFMACMESENAWLTRCAKGIQAHARLIARMRPCIPNHHALVPAGPVRVRYTGPKPRGRSRCIAQRAFSFQRAA